MNPLRHSLHTLWIRFHWEILGFAVLVFLSAVAPSTAWRSWSGTFGLLELLGLFWLTLRLLLADDGFKTHGGWRARPVRPGHLLTAQLIILVLVAGLPLALHAAMIHTRYHPDGGQWHAMPGGGFLRGVLGWLAFAGCVKLFALLILRPLEGTARKAAWAVLVIVLVPVTLRIIPRDAFGSSYGGGGSGDPPGILAGSIQDQLPQVTEFIGEWNDPVGDMVPQARLLLSVPLDGAAWPSVPGLRITGVSHAPTGQRTTVRVSLESLDERLIGTLERVANPILLYANGMAATCMHHMHYRHTAGSSYLPVYGLDLHVSFFSPASLPENRDEEPSAFPPTLLLFFVEDPNAPKTPASLDRLSADPYPPAPPFIQEPEQGDAFDLAIRQLIDSLAAKDRQAPAVGVSADQLPAAAMRPILAYHPWPERAWRESIHPFLKKHASEEDKAVLLARLALDPRLTELFIEKNWSSDAIPVLRERAEQGLDLDAVSLRLLAEQADLDLGNTLAHLAIRLPKGIGELALFLRESPGFDWPAFVNTGWRSRKYGNYSREGWLYALWAAELGDRSALRRLAEEAAAGKTWERDQLMILVPGAPTDLINHLRQQLDRLAYRPDSQNWELR